MLSTHSTKNMPFIVMISSNAFSLATRRGFTITSRRQTCRLGVETCRVPAIEKIQDRQICLQSVLGLQGCAVVDFMEKSTTINAVSYCATLAKLQAAMKQQRPGHLGYNRCFASAR